MIDGETPGVTRIEWRLEKSEGGEKVFPDRLNYQMFTREGLLTPASVVRLRVGDLLVVGGGEGGEGSAVWTGESWREARVLVSFGGSEGWRWDWSGSGSVEEGVVLIELAGFGWSRWSEEMGQGAVELERETAVTRSMLEVLDRGIGLGVAEPLYTWEEVVRLSANRGGAEVGRMW